MALLLAASILALLGHTHASESIVRRHQDSAVRLTSSGKMLFTTKDATPTPLSCRNAKSRFDDTANPKRMNLVKNGALENVYCADLTADTASATGELMTQAALDTCTTWTAGSGGFYTSTLPCKEVEFATQKNEQTCDRDFALALQDVAHDFGNKCEKAVTNNDAFGITDPDTCKLAADRLSLEYAGMATNWYVPNATLYMTKNCSLVCVGADGVDVPHNTAPCTPNAEGDCELAGVVPNCAGTLKVFFNPTEPIPDTYETAVGQQICLRQLYPRGIKGQNHATAGACGSTADGGEDPAWEAILDYQACRDAFLCTVGMSGCEMPEFEDHGSVRVPNRPKGCYREPVGTNEHGQTQGCYNFNRIEPTEAAEGWAVCQKVGTVESVAANARTPRA